MEDRVVAYIDGFNLYFGLRSQRLRHLYWLDVAAMVRKLLEKHEAIVATKYFTSRVSGPPEKVHRQTEYIEALQARPGIQLFFGVYQSEQRTCSACGTAWYVHNEKQTDVNIAVEMLVDAHRNVFDAAVLVTADADLVPAVGAIRALFPHKRVMVFFPPGRGSVRLQQEVHAKRRIREWVVRSSQLPDEVIGLDGYPRRRPKEWNIATPDGSDKALPGDPQ